MFPAKYQPLLHGGNAFFFFNTFLYARHLFFPRGFKQAKISIYFFSLSLSLSALNPSNHQTRSFLFFWFGRLHPDVYDKNSSRAVTNRPCIQARYLIRFLSPLKCGLWCGEGLVLVINAPERKEVAQVILFFWGRVGSGERLRT